ncbi:MAG: hypothetical protein HRU20_08480 [Pseudomonadales bacterium]|nr:hypothetical protein [Pseudomonadales bacterium]
MEIASLILGWLLGVLSPVIISRFQHDFNQHDVLNALLKELENLQFRFLCAAQLLTARYGNYDKDFVIWCLAEFRAFPEESAAESIISYLNMVVALDDKDFKEHCLKQQAEGITAQNLKKHYLHLTELHMNKLQSFNLPFQADLLEVKANIGFYNDEVEKIEKFFLMTYDPSISVENYDRIINEIANRYRSIAEICIKVSTLISNIHTRETKINKDKH